MTAEESLQLRLPNHEGRACVCVWLLCLQIDDTNTVRGEKRQICHESLSAEGSFRSEEHSYLVSFLSLLMTGEVVKITQE